MSSCFNNYIKLPLQAVEIISSYLDDDVRLNQSISLRLPENSKKLIEKVLYPVRHFIERQYQELPWPKHMNKVVVLTQIRGGRGDYAAAAKAISLMLRICPTLHIDWVISSGSLKSEEALSFLTPSECKKVNFRNVGEPPIDKSPVDFMIVGPVPDYWSTPEASVDREIVGPAYGFQEIAGQGLRSPNIQEWVDMPTSKNCDAEYFKIHPRIFSTDGLSMRNQLPMGLDLGTGVFLDQNLMQAPLSHEFSDLSYLSLIQDKTLRKDIFDSMRFYQDKLDPIDDERLFKEFSFNSGYAHELSSREDFVDTIARQEKKKHVIIVLNQKAYSEVYSPKEYWNQIFTSERLVLLEKLGYGSVTLKAQEKEGQTVEHTLILSENGQNKRDLTIIARPFIQADDFKQIQLASERLLATGDNTAIEAFCARCKLYQYESLLHKVSFLRQQRDIAKNIAPALSKFLEYSGSRDSVEWQTILDNPQLASDTLKFCTYITEHFGFNPVFEGGVKRAVWHSQIPELSTIEAQALNPDFRSDLIKYLQDSTSVQSLNLTSLPQLKERITECVKNHTRLV